MSNRLAKFRSARNSAASAFTQVIQLNNKYENPLFCCFEGEDFKYYGVRIEHISSLEYDKLIPIKCGGKKEVIRLRELISKEETVNTKKSVYFIDLDFDESIPNKNEVIYETPFYSIENFYTTQCAFEKILSSELKLEEINPEYQHSLTQFLERQKEFHSGALYLNAWIYCQRKANTDKLYLNEFKLSKIISDFSLNTLEFIDYDKDFLRSCLPNAVDIDDSEIQNAKDILKTNSQQSFRGKFEIEFLYDFLTLLIMEINKKEAPFNKCKKVSVNLSKVNILSELSQYAHTPKCLKEYIKKSA
ncbi:DUF4435 domain-containing protein [Tenacibaculum finnmarkense genomovar ulcerans]|uniref:DUF4435 domain-containing protein n=1 Tax=Tenacibaculum finnmarkense TaxID=2781243 RepID=UPI00187B5972|nr:DUF4435 domain-containing protein [Tenacibaculum finnmarkense]MBE7635116.1 DUF4435 domain-containing protein [Tenacibaculum finnmarkense genomovar ulcerans]MCD8431107.1 DUF4435 domain-containing protein [Tenacibaculum finnmarkense genomovar ulcerans]